MKYNKLGFLLPFISLFLSAKGHHFGETGNGKANNPRRHREVVTKYEIRLTFRGFVSLYGTAADCPVGRNGKVVLTGLLGGAENVGPADDIVYEGVLSLDITNMDICSVKRLANGEDQFCSITVSGSGKVKTTLEIYSDGQNKPRGAYIKINNDSTVHGRFTRNVGGTCDTEQIDEERNMVPNETIASIFNGRDLNMIHTRTLQVGRYVEMGSQDSTVLEVLRVVR